MAASRNSFSNDPLAQAKGLALGITDCHKFEFRRSLTLSREHLNVDKWRTYEGNVWQMRGTHPGLFVSQLEPAAGGYPVTTVKLEHDDGGGGDDDNVLVVQRRRHHVEM